MSLSRDEVCSKVNHLFVELFELEPEQLKPEAQLYSDLSLDSLDAIDLIVSFERVFKIKPNQEEVRGVRTLEDVHNLVFKYYTNSGELH